MPIRPLSFLILLALLAQPLPAYAADEPEQVASLAAAQTAEPAVVSKGMDELVSLDFKSTDVVDALKYLAIKGGLNLSTSKTVAGRVNLSLTNVPIRDVFDLILQSNNLAYVRQGDVYHILTDEEYRALYGRKFFDTREIRSFRLQYASPEAAFNLLDALKSEIGRLLVDEETGTVMVMDTPIQIRRMEETLSTLERGSPTRVFDIKYAKAKDVEERLKDQIELRKLGYVKADERTNQLIVKTLPERMSDVERVINALDQKTREVLIDAKIVKITVTRNLDTGIDWDSFFKSHKFFGVDHLRDFRTASTSTAASLLKIPITKQWGQIAIGGINESGYELLRYLEKLGQTKVISTPRILVTNGSEAKIHVGTREAYVTTTTTTGQTTSTTAEEVQFIDVGIQLAVTPTINSDGYVSMKIKPEISSVVRTLTTPTKNEIPIVDTSTAETIMLVKVGSTVVLGGLGKNQKKHVNSEIPILAKIPLIGEAFRRRDRDDERQELVVFVTPHIITGDELVSGKQEEFKEGLGKGMRPYRDYPTIVEPKEELPPAGDTTADPWDAPEEMPAEPAQSGAAESATRFRVKERLR